MMTNAEYSDDYNEAVNLFLKLHGQELKMWSFMLTRCYGIDFHELLSRTTVTVWEKWSKELYGLPDNERYKYTLRVLSNHARNLSKNAKRYEDRCDLLSGEELERLTHATPTCQDPVVAEVIFKDERFAIYRVISQLSGRCRDVMTLLALGLEDSEIRQELGMTMTNLTTTKSRARKLLLEILRQGNQDEGGELR